VHLLKRAKRRFKTGDCGESGNTSSEALCSFWVPLELSWNVEFPPGVRTQYGQSNHQVIASSTLSDYNMPAKLIDTNKDNSDYESGCSEHS
jgi:hypothetical protein